MPTINQLSAVNAVAGSDQVPVYSSDQGDARKASFSTVLQYVKNNFADPNYEVIINAPVTGFNLQLNSTSNIQVILNPAGTLTTGTITLPAVADCFDGQEIIFVSTETISALTINANGATTVGAPAGLSATSTFTIRFNKLQSTWYTIVNNPQISGADVVTTTAAQTLTNKLIDFGDNTLGLTSLQLSNAVGDKTGAGSLVFSSSPQLVTPNLGNPASGILTSCTGYTIDNVTGVNSNLTNFLKNGSAVDLRTGTVGTTGGAGNLVFSSGPTLSGKVRFSASSYMDIDTVSASGSTVTLDMDQTNQFRVDMGANVTTFNVTNAADGQGLVIRFAQDSTGSRTIAWPSEFKWPGGVTPVLSTGANAVDVLQATRYGSVWYGNLLKGFA